jgi:serine/threonine protein kinase
MPPIQEKWSVTFRDFVSKCLIKDPEKRWTAAQLLAHEFVQDTDNYKSTFGHLVGEMCKID